MLKKTRVALAALAVSAVLFSAVPAFACNGTTPPPCPPPSNGCEIPRGQINGWIPCGDGCCKIPPGQIKGWEPCGSGDCLNPRGEHNGWVPCGDKD